MRAHGDYAKARGLDKVLFRDEIHPDEIPNVYAQCHVGLVALGEGAAKWACAAVGGNGAAEWVERLAICVTPTGTPSGVGVL